MKDDAAPSPLVSIGIPLYRAQRFVSRIVGNIQRIDYPNLEFLVADQHGHDQAVAELREQVGDDPRVRFFESRDELNWIQNYNFVMNQATGKYFRLLTQDDRIPAESISAAVEELEASRELAGVEGPIDTIDTEGRVLSRGSEHLPAPATVSGERSLLDSLALFGGWRHREANLALVRVSAYRDHGLRVPDTHGRTGLSMRAWLFALSLRGRFRFLPAYRNQRCIHPDSFTSRQMQRSTKDQILRLLSYLKEGIKISWESDSGTLARVMLVPAIFACGLILPSIRAMERLSK